MERSLVVRGKIDDPRRIDLDEALPEVRGPVEVTVRPIERDAGASLFESTTQAEWEQEFHAWIQAHDRRTPVPSAESLRREALYEDRP